MKIRLKKPMLPVRLREVLKYYTGRRKGTFATLLISLATSFFIVFWIFKLYSPFDPKTRLSFQGTSGYDISSVETYIEYNKQGEDTVTAYVNLTPASDEALDKLLFITKSSNLTYQREGSFFSGPEYFDCRPSFSMCLRLKDAKPHTVILNFAGNAFGHGSQDERLDFTVDVGKNGAVESVPVTMRVGNLSEVNIGTEVPEPTQKYVGGVTYNFEPGEMPSVNEIIISGVNRQSIYSTQFELFLLGTFLGILVSIITTIFLEAVQKYESTDSLQ